MQGLPEESGWQTVLGELLGLPEEAFLSQKALPVTFSLLPSFKEQVLEHRDGHYLVQDWMGANVEISDQYDATYLRSAKDFVTRRWHHFPVLNRSDWEKKIRWRKGPDSLCAPWQSAQRKWWSLSELLWPGCNRQNQPQTGGSG